MRLFAGLGESDVCLVTQAAIHVIRYRISAYLRPQAYGYSKLARAPQLSITMSDPIPSASADHEGLENPPPANAEDRKAAAALSSLHTNEIGATASPTRGPSNADQEALGKAMSRLEIASGHGMGRKQPGETLNNGVEVKKKAIKISPADVTFLVCL